MDLVQGGGRPKHVDSFSRVANKAECRRRMRNDRHPFRRSKYARQCSKSYDYNYKFDQGCKVPVDVDKHIPAVVEDRSIFTNLRDEVVGVNVRAAVNSTTNFMQNQVGCRGRRRRDRIRRRRTIDIRAVRTHEPVCDWFPIGSGAMVHIIPPKSLPRGNYSHS